MRFIVPGPFPEDYKTYCCHKGVTVKFNETQRRFKEKGTCFSPKCAAMQARVRFAKELNFACLCSVKPALEALSVSLGMEV